MLIAVRGPAMYVLGASPAKGTQSSGSIERIATYASPAIVISFEPGRRRSRRPDLGDWEVYILARRRPQVHQYQQSV